MNSKREVNDMDDNTLQTFLSDVISEVNQKHIESQKEMQNNPNDSFVCGRALAFEEMVESIQTRMKVYDITIEQNTD